MKSKYKKKILLEANYTVEAALIVPMILFVIFLVIYMSMYLSDCATINRVVAQGIMLASKEIKHPLDEMGKVSDYENIDKRGIYFNILGSCKEEEEKVIASIKEKLSQKLWVTKVNNMQLELSTRDVKVLIEANVNIPIAPVKSILGKKKLSILINEDEGIYYPAEFIRKFDTLGQWGDK